MNATTFNPDDGRRSGGPGIAIVGVALAVAVLLVAVGLWRMADSYGEQACLTRVLAEYPAVPVSAYDSPRTTGSLKLSYDAERRKALDEC